MKNIKKICFLVLLVSSLISCTYEPELKSSITFYPELTLNGDSVVVLNQGTTYNELGAVSISGTEELPVSTDGEVDTNTIGVYKVTYESFNKDGFSASKTRTVIVLDPTPSTINLEGTFFRNGVNANVVTRISDRVYRCDNATGYTTGAPENLTLVFYNLDDSRIYAPFQENASSTGISAESNIGEIVSENNFKWIIYASGFFGTAVRNFTR
jgi:hypothetical protein